MQFVLQAHFTYPWPPVYLVTAVLKAISTSGTSSGVRSFSLTGSMSPAVYRVVMRPSLQPTWYRSSSLCSTTTRRFLLSLGPRSNSGTFSVALSPTSRALKRCFALLVILSAVFFLAGCSQLPSFSELRRLFSILFLFSFLFLLSFLFLFFLFLLSFLFLFILEDGV